MEYSHSELKSIEKEIGSPYYILSVDRFKQNVTSFLYEFRKYYDNTQIAYSYKTNYIPKICTAVNDMGGLAEVVSGMEYAIATRVGVSPRNIVFNGPSKTMEQFETAVTAGSKVNLDSPAEVELLKAVASKYQEREFGIGLRVNFEHADNAPFSRFGFNVENSDFKRAVDAVTAIGNVSIEGLHCHFRVPGRTPEGYNRIARTMLDLSAEHFEPGQLRYIDIGGGFFSRMPEEFARQFKTPVPTYRDYAQAIAPEFDDFFKGLDDKPLLIMEPGTAVAADVMVFVAKITDVKSLPDRRLAMTDGSAYNIKPTLNKMNLPARIVPASSDGVDSMYDIVGYTCKEDDVMFQGFNGKLSTGDYIVFNNVGSYTVVLQPPFIRLAPPIVEMVDGRVEVVRRAQSLDTLLSDFAG